MRKMAVFLAIMLLGLAIAPYAAASLDSLKVIITVEDKVYNAGDDVNITVHVFDKGV
ncbi:MAG: hypothetical protein JSW28_07365 [Thermoplasmata archaeon]|nr:MAG: hypothetical protein JSW28_07365 [Thermoplasmata archaeon]